MSTAASAALAVSSNTQKMPSPSLSTTNPPWAATAERTTPR